MREVDGQAKKGFGDSKEKSVWNNLRKINKDLENLCDLAKDIGEKIAFKANNASFESAEIIKYASSFTPDQVTIHEVQSANHQYHEMTIANNTDFIWEKIYLWVPEAAEILHEPFNLKPREILKFNILFKYRLFQQFGTYTIQVKLRSHVISENCPVSRINLISLQANQNFHFLLTKNHFMEIENCTISYVGSDSVRYDLNVKLDAFSEKQIKIEGLIPGDQVCFQVFEDEKPQSELGSFLVT